MDFDSLLCKSNLGFDLKLWPTVDGLETIELFNAVHPDLYIIDANIQGMKCDEICRWIRANESERHSGIIIISDDYNGGEAYSVQCLILGADDFVRLPCTPAELVARMHSIIRFKVMTDRLRTANYKLKQLVQLDELTGLANMRGFKKTFSQLMGQCRKKKMALGMIMLDIDKFKNVNDSHNHLVGSAVLRQAGILIKSMLNLPLDKAVIARFGGDEFLACFSSPSLDDTFHIADSIRKVFEGHEFEVEGKKLFVTVSLGASWISPGFSGPSQDFMKLADIMLYKSKGSGRNKVSVMQLRYPMDFNHICRVHGIDRDSSCDDDNITTFNNTKVS